MAAAVALGARLCTLRGDIRAEASGGPANLSSDFAAAQANLHQLVHDLYAVPSATFPSKQMIVRLLVLRGPGQAISATS